MEEEKLCGMIEQQNKELDTLKKFIYSGEGNLVSKISSLETKINTMDANCNGLNSKYEIFKAEDRKGRWGLTLLLVSTLIGWLVQYFTWLTQ